MVADHILYERTFSNTFGDLKTISIIQGQLSAICFILVWAQGEWGLCGREGAKETFYQ